MIVQANTKGVRDLDPIEMLEWLAAALDDPGIIHPREMGYLPDGRHKSNYPEQFPDYPF